MVEKVPAETLDEAAKPAIPQAPFTKEKVKVCASCGTVNPSTAEKCGGCGDSLAGSETKTPTTVAASCPHCGNDRPYLPTQDSDGFETGVEKDQYQGDCPSCHQTEASANAALDALKQGKFGEGWGGQTGKFYP